MSTGATTVFMTAGEFEMLKHDPMLILERANQMIEMMEKQEHALKDEAQMIQHQVENGNAESISAEQHTTLMEAASELAMDHQALSQKFVDLETTNKKLQSIVEALRNDKQALAQEVSALKEEQASSGLNYTKMSNAIKELEEDRARKEAQLKIHQDEINAKIAQLDAATNSNMEKTQRTIELQDATEKIGSGRLALEAETTALEQATQQQERTINYLQSELTSADDALKNKSAELVQLKKHLSASVLELQLQITKAEEEISRVRTAVANEKDLTGRQNLWLAKDLQAKTQELLLTRQELTKENAELKSQLSLLREKATRLKSNVLVVEKRNQILHEDLRRLEEEDDVVKSVYTRTKDEAFDEMNRQTAVVSQLNADLQTAREDLYLIKSKLCKWCRDALLQGAGASNGDPLLKM